MTRRLFYTDHCVLPLPPEHKFPIGKYRMLRELLVKDGFFTLEEAPLAHTATIVLAHDAEYVEAFLQGTLSAGSVRRIGFPWSPGLVRMTLSVHCKNNFPLRKQQSSLDVELDAGVGDEEYLRVLEAVLPRVWEFGPEFVFYQSGVDGLASDRLGRLRLSHAGLMERDRMVMRGVRELGVPFVITLGGGDSEPIAVT